MFRSGIYFDEFRLELPSRQYPVDLAIDIMVRVNQGGCSLDLGADLHHQWKNPLTFRFLITVNTIAAGQGIAVGVRLSPWCWKPSQLGGFCHSLAHLRAGRNTVAVPHK